MHLAAGGRGIFLRRSLFAVTLLWLWGIPFGAGAFGSTLSVGTAALICGLLTAACVFARVARVARVVRVALLLVAVFGDSLEGRAVVIPFGGDFSLAVGGIAAGRALGRIGVFLRRRVFIAVGR